MSVRASVSEFAGRAAELLPRRADALAMRSAPRADIVAGLTVAVVALPLALAFGVASGLGAEAGVITAIVAGLLAAIFGGSNLQVSGPTGAMTVVLVPVAHQHGRDGVLLVGLLAGIILIVMALLRLGVFVRYLPVSVIEGFTAGIAVVIALQQIPLALGVPAGDAERMWRVAVDAAVDFWHDPSAAAPLIALLVTAAVLTGQRLRPGWPHALIAVGVATVVTRIADIEVPTIGALPAGLPAPSADFIDPDAIGVLLTSALAVAALSALESLLCATVADSMTVDQRHDPDRELFGQGIANVAVPFFGGVPATAAIARTAVNVGAGARSRLASIVHALVLLGVVAVAAGLVAQIPLAALAGVLLATTIRMVEISGLLALARSSRSDALVLITTFAVTVLVDLVAAVGVGLLVAMVLGLRSIARSSRLETVPLDLTDHADEEHALLRDHIVALRFDGPLLFVAAHQLMAQLPDLSDVRVVIIRMSRVSGLDATGALLLRDAVLHLQRRGITVLVSGLSPRHEPALDELGVLDVLRASGHVFDTSPEAIAAARQIVHAP